MSDHSTAFAAEQPGLGVPNGKLAMWLFLASEVMFFTGLIGAYVVLRQGSSNWPVPSSVLNIPLTALNTFILICSSLTMVKSHAAAERDDQKALKGWLIATIAFGTIFLCIQAHEYHALLSEGFSPHASLFGSCFYTMTGFHGFHVFGGVVLLICMAVKAFRGQFTGGRAGALEISGLYWHFVDLVWIILFTIVYLI